MTTIREIITDAFRENNLISVGDVPEGAAYVEAEAILLEFISSLFETELGESLTNVLIEAGDTYLPPNSRVVITSDSPNSIELSETPSDGEQFSVVDPRGLLTNLVIEAGVGTIEGDTSVTLDSSESEYTWFYRADKGNWVKVSNLTADDESPFPAVFNDMLRLWLSLRIAPRNGAQTKPESVQVQNRIAKKFTAKYRQKRQMTVDNGLLFLPSNRLVTARINWATGTFN